MPRLRRADCSGPGIRRLRRGRGFSYEEEDGERIADQEVVERIRELAIPPAWKEVWICPDARGHIQATGFDAAGRKQYLYQYLRAVTGGDFTAKDFRTWNATVLAAVQVATLGEDASSKTVRKRIATEATKAVAEYLSNTPAVCRSAYIDPRVFDRFDAGETIAPDLDRIVRGTDPGEFPDREPIERAVLKLA